MPGICSEARAFLQIASFTSIASHSDKDHDSFPTFRIGVEEETMTITVPMLQFKTNLRNENGGNVFVFKSQLIITLIVCKMAFLELIA